MQQDAERATPESQPDRGDDSPPAAAPVARAEETDFESGLTTAVLPSPAAAQASPAKVALDPSGQTWRSIGLLALILLVGIGLRVPLAFQAGYGADVEWFSRWTRVATLHGLKNLYATTDCNYPPLYVLVMRGAGELWQAISDPELRDTTWYRAYERAPACVADILLAIVLWVEARRLFSARAAALAAGLYFLNPATMYVSAYWGQVDSVHTLFLTLALIACNRHSRYACGFFIGLSLLQKLQSVAVLPLFLLEFYRYERWRGLAGVGIGALLAAVLVLSPFVFTGSFDLAMHRGYGQAVGYYQDRSLYAFNVWTLLDQHDASDRDVPEWLLRIHAGPGQLRVPVKGAWYSNLTYRTLSLAIFALFVALILSIYAWTRRHDARSLAAGLLVFAFFLFPTEMHERYVFPALGLLVIWALVSRGRIAMYCLFSALFLLNVAAVLHPDSINRVLSLGLIITFVAMLWALVAQRRSPLPAGPAFMRDPAVLEELPPARSRLIQAFQWLTLAGCIAAVAGACWAWDRQHHAPPVASDEQTLYLSHVAPLVEANAWRTLARDQAVSRSTLQCAGEYFFRGLGMHAPARVAYAAPPGFDRLLSSVCVDPHHKGHVIARVRLDGRVAWEQRLSPGDVGEVDIPLEGARVLMLEADPAGEQRSDHVNWCGARLLKSRE